MFSFFLGELEKCLEDPEKLGSLFVKHVSANVFIDKRLLLPLTNVFDYSIFIYGTTQLRKCCKIFFPVRSREMDYKNL